MVSKLELVLMQGIVVQRLTNQKRLESVDWLVHQIVLEKPAERMMDAEESVRQAVVPAEE